ncbi:hypothetical protein AAEX28_14545 [Lentisphaerota bacterium WC36G]|nr:hypothetical protein LJT99_01300 [Lentisphaerae bacterium WC36]
MLKQRFFALILAAITTTMLGITYVNAEELTPQQLREKQRIQEEREFIASLVSKTVITLSQEEQQIFNYHKKFLDSKTLVEEGDFRAMLPLALCYEYGLGTERDISKAVELYLAMQRRVESDKITTKGLLQLAKIYLEPNQQFNNLEKAVYITGEAITYGNKDAYALLAELTLRGLGVNKDVDKALRYLEAGVKVNSGACYYKLGKIAGMGLYNQVKDSKKELEYYQKGAELDDPGALVALAKYYYGLKSVVVNDELVIKPDFGRASELLQKAIRYNVYKYDELVKIYDVVTDEELRSLITTAYFLQQLVKLDPDNQYAIMELAKCYFRGYGVKKDFQTGARLLEILVTRDFVPAEVFLAHAYGRGMQYLKNADYDVAGVKNEYLNPKRAFEIYHRLADEHNLCNFELARFYLTGVGGVKMDEERGLKYIDKALQHHEKSAEIFRFLSAYYGLPQYYATDERSEQGKSTGKMANRSIAIVDKYLKRIKVDSNASKFLANVYYYGAGVKKNPQRFLFTLNVAFMKGDQASGMALISAYLKGIGAKVNSRVAMIKAKEYLDRPMHSSNEIIEIIELFAKHGEEKMVDMIAFITAKAAAKEMYFDEALKYCATKGYARKYKVIKKK